ncbi:MAG: hypothetical protein ABH852_04985 [Methanobacteriota archaeon]
MSAIDILYIVFLVGSLAFGLEVMLIGLGGKLMLRYRRRKATTLVVALLVGFLVVTAAVFTSVVFGLEPIYFAIIVMVYSFIAGQIIKAFRSKLVGTSSPPTMPKTSDKEIEEIIVRRGYGDLVGKPNRRRKVSRRK